MKSEEIVEATVAYIDGILCKAKDSDRSVEEAIDVIRKHTDEIVDAVLAIVGRIQ